MTRPLRILYHHRTAANDGMRVHIDKIVRALRARGHEVLVVGPSGAAASAGAKLGRLEAMTDRLRRHLPGLLFEILELAYNILAYLRLARAERAFRPDILYERYNLYLLAGLLLSWRRGLPMLLEINSPLAAERAAAGGLSLGSLARACEAALWRGCDAALPVTGVLAAMVRRVRGTGGQMQVVHNGADLSDGASEAEASAIRRRFGIGPNDVVLGFAGFVRAWHGVEWAVDALAGVPSNVHLLVVGDGPALPALSERAAVQGVAERVHFTGRVPHGEMAAHMRAFDVALQPAAVAYASPLKLFEYMALGRAIVAPDQPNIREVLVSGHNGLLFEPGNRAAFAWAVTRLCEDWILRRHLGDSARRTVETAPFTWTSNAGRIEALARDLVTSAAEPAAASSVAAAR
ncbi:MAG: glycosyltransferase family 4 protein [Alphaproteobacteria bacterium]|nr:glycosyltransferase family 4 protein [Alphaproteobacteria bacterium]